MIDKRPEFFGRLMPKEPTDDILVKNYHATNKAFELFPDRRGDIIDVDGDCAICMDGKRLKIDKD